MSTPVSLRSSKTRKDWMIVQILIVFIVIVGVLIGLSIWRWPKEKTVYKCKEGQVVQEWMDKAYRTCTRGIKDFKVEKVERTSHIMPVYTCEE